MFKGKPVKIIITGKAKEVYDKLNGIVREEISKGITSSDHQTLFNSIKLKIELVRNNPEYGIHIPKNRIAKEYILDHKIYNKKFKYRKR